MARLTTPTQCRYDWAPGFVGLKLRCVDFLKHRHNSPERQALVFVLPQSSTLADMLAAGLLVGVARSNAEEQRRKATPRSIGFAAGAAQISSGRVVNHQPSGSPGP